VTSRNALDSEMRECRSCAALLPVSNFGVYAACGRARRRRTCNACRRAAEARRYAGQPGTRERMQAAAKKSRLRSQYGLSVEELDGMIAAQGGLCAICEQAKPLCVDHDHSTGVVRGLLCKTCNFGLGYFHDNEQKLSAARHYLRGEAAEALRFCVWLRDVLSGATELTPAQTEQVKKHLALVFTHEIDPSAGAPKHQAALNAIHAPATSRPPGGTVYRC
jgi:hypothetical protein